MCVCMCVLCACVCACARVVRMHVCCVRYMVELDHFCYLRKAKISADFPKKQVGAVHLALTTPITATPTQVVDEYLSPKDKLPPLGALDWRMPDITMAMVGVGFTRRSAHLVGTLCVLC